MEYLEVARKQSEEMNGVKLVESLPVSDHELLLRTVHHVARCPALAAYCAVCVWPWWEWAGVSVERKTTFSMRFTFFRSEVRIISSISS